MSVPSSPPPPRSAGVGSEPLIPVRALLALLRSVGLLRELSGDDAEALAQGLASQEEAGRWVEALRRYYMDPADPACSARRRHQDRFYLHDAAETYAATELVRRLAALTPELPGLSIERLGGEEGVLVLRAGDQVAPVLDPDETSVDTGEVDLAALEQESARSAAVQGIVRAVNALLSRLGAPRRFVQLRSDEQCEVYLAVSLDDALGMLAAGVLEDADEEELRDFGCW